MIEYLGLWVLIALSLNMWALQTVLGSKTPLTKKALWTIVLLALPGLAFFIWYLIGPRKTA